MPRPSLSYANVMSTLAVVLVLALVVLPVVGRQRVLQGAGRVAGDQVPDRLRADLLDLEAPLREAKELHPMAFPGLQHVAITVSDLERSSRFYDALLAPLGWRRRPKMSTSLR